MNQFENINVEQLQHIKYLMVVMKKNNKKFEDLDNKFLNKYLTLEEIVLFYQFLVKFYQEKLKIYSSKLESKFELSWEEYNPYKVLGISENEYTKEQLLNVLKSSINKLKPVKNKQKKNLLIDQVLDAYNDIINKRV